MKQRIATLCLSTVFAFASFADGGETGNGGNAYCSQYMGFLNFMTSALVNIGQANIDKVNRLIQAAPLRETFRQMRCEPVTELDRTVRTGRVSPTQIRSRLHWQEWKNLSWDQMHSLAAHELAVAAELEGEGEYTISHDIAKILYNSKPYAWRKCLSSDAVGDHFVCIVPRRGNNFIATESPVNGVCRYLGYSRATAHAVFKKGNQERLAIVLNDLGLPVSEPAWRWGGGSVYESVSCQ